MRGPPPPPPPPGASLGATPSKTAGKTKGIFWQSIKPTLIAKSLWHGVDPASLPQDIKCNLEAAFAKKRCGPLTPKHTNLQALGKRQLLDPSRERNVGIVLQFLKLDAEQIQSAILDLDEELVGDEAASALLSIFPSPEERKTVLAAPPTEIKTPTHKFFLMCSRNPSFEGRLRCWLSMRKFEENLSTVRACIAQIVQASLAVRQSATIRDFFSFILRIGNFLNTGTAIANSQGFRIVDLQRVKGVLDVDYDTSSDEKNADLAHSLLMFCVKAFGLKQLEPVLQLICPLQNACKVDLSSLQSDMAEVRSHVESCAIYATSTEDAKVFQHFAQDAKRKVQLLETDCAQMHHELDELLNFCGEARDGCGSDPTELFSTLTQFLLDVDRCFRIANDL
jgi:hypothetical protein